MPSVLISSQLIFPALIAVQQMSWHKGEIQTPLQSSEGIYL